MRVRVQACVTTLVYLFPSFVFLCVDTNMCVYVCSSSVLLFASKDVCVACRYLLARMKRIEAPFP